MHQCYDVLILISRSLMVSDFSSSCFSQSPLAVSLMLDIHSSSSSFTNKESSSNKLMCDMYDNVGTQKKVYKLWIQYLL